jgi:hypothetical protein
VPGIEGQQRGRQLVQVGHAAHRVFQHPHRGAEQLNRVCGSSRTNTKHLYIP